MTPPKKPRPLNLRMQRFVGEFLVDLNAKQAALRAGYSPKTSYSIGHRLLKNVEVAAAISAAQAKQLRSTDLSASRVLAELRRLAFIDVTSFFTEDGRVKPPNELTAEQGAALASYEVVIKNAEAGGGVTDATYKFRLWDKLRALEMLARHYALLTDVMRVEQTQSLEARLIAGRQRVAAARAARLLTP